MALVNFIPQNVVQAFVLTELRKRMVFRDLITVQTPANLGRGESYQIPGLGAITVGDYTGAAITTQDVTDSKKTLTVDQSKYFSFRYDKVQNAKAAYSVFALFGQKGAYELANIMDQYVASVLASQAGTKEDVNVGSVATPIDIDETNIVDYIATVKEIQDANSVPEMDRWFVVPPFMSSAIAKANILETTTVSEQARSEGFMGRFLGYNFHMSNNLVKVSANVGQQPIAGIKSSFVLANILNEFEMWDKVEGYFAEMMKGLNVYGGLTVTPEAVVRGVVSKA